MTKDEALKLALEAAYLAGFNDSGEGYNGEYPFRDHCASPLKDHHWILRRDEYIQKALAQPEQEPVAWLNPYGGVIQKRITGHERNNFTIPLYTTPPQRKPLTDEEIWDEVKAADLDWQTGWSLDEDASNRYITFARAIEAAHGIRG